MQEKKQQLELDMEQLSSKLRKEYVKSVYCHLVYLTYMQSTSCEALGWMTHKLDQDCQEKYQQPQICRWYHPNGRKWRGTKEPLGEGKMGEWKSWLKNQHSDKQTNNKRPSMFKEQRSWHQGNNRKCDRLYFLGLQNSLQSVTAAMKLKDTCSLEEKLWPS